MQAAQDTTQECVSTDLKDDIYYEVVITSDDLEVLEFFGMGLSETEGIEFLEDNILKLP
ncbi:hypothetical protein [Helicobacter sp. 13S00401-1]|uniref:hypothetical protein n=1 Tax=Helicobacter sp. 13S00401-1 TaxID=1905758 RepID=UPI0015561A9E|nr:hypothetical protein [Helicobacter sp. 13S00401-1]